MKTLFFAICMMMVGAVAQAQELPGEDASAMPHRATCQKGSLTRIVEVRYAGEQGKPPCEVHYMKTTEEPGHDQSLWDSQHTANYCETKMQEFVDKLRGMGWDCS